MMAMETDRVWSACSRSHCDCISVAYIEASPDQLFNNEARANRRKRLDSSIQRRRRQSKIRPKASLHLRQVSEYK